MNLYYTNGSVSGQVDAKKKGLEKKNTKKNRKGLGVPERTPVWEKVENGTALALSSHPRLPLRAERMGVAVKKPVSADEVELYAPKVWSCVQDRYQ